MSTWHVRAIERLGTPLPGWPTIWGPAEPGADAIAANGLHTVDLTPYLSPLSDFSSTLERDLTKASFGSVNLDLVDGNESLAILLGPASTTLATTGRYYGPWIEITEVWGSLSAVRWTGYLDETSIQWDEARAITQATILHASQLLRERKLSDMTSLLRPFPKGAAAADTTMTATTGDDAMAGWLTPRSDKLAREQALWTYGSFTLRQDLKHYDTADFVDGEWVTRYWGDYAPGGVPSSAVTIAGTTYPVLDVVWSSDSFLSYDETYNDGRTRWDNRYSVSVVRLLGAPNLSSTLHVGDTITFTQTESERSHYELVEAVAAPPSGQDGQRWLKLDTLDQLLAGDDLTITFWDTANSVQRRATLDVRVIDTDGESGKVWLKDPVTQALATANVLKIRRNSRDPRQVDGMVYAAAAIAPWTLDTTYLAPAETGSPIVTWRPQDKGVPHLYGFHHIQSLNRTGALRLSRRGPVLMPGGTYPLAGVWEGSWSAGFAWFGSSTASKPLEILGDLNQWPGGSNTLLPPPIYIHGDLSGGATIPPNGWKGAYRSWKAPTIQIQDAESWWNGTAIQWTSQAAVGLVPTKLVAFAAQTASPGRYTRTSAPAWTFEPHSGAGTLGAPVTPTLTGTPPAGNWLALGMGIYASGDEQEALLGVVSPDTAQPFTSVSAAVLSQASGGNLTVRQSIELWNSGLATPAGTWALGGGLVVQIWVETLDGTPYPHTRLHLLDGAAHTWGDFATYEIIPQTIQPLALSGTPGSKKISGWYALAMETYLDDNFVVQRRLRFLALNRSFAITNGEYETPALFPTVVGKFGDIIAESMPDGAVPVRMIRTGVGDTMEGFFGGRLFGISTKLSTTVDCLQIGDLSAADYVEQFANTVLASAIPDNSGNMRLVSRGSGPLRVRPNEGQSVSIQAIERGPRKTLQTYRSYISEVRISYTDLVSGESREATYAPGHDGGKPINMDMSNLVGGVTAARAIGRAFAYWFGPPCGVITETWVDDAPGVASGLSPAFWSAWNVGDLITFVIHATGSTNPLVAYKIHQFKPRPEAREVGVELLKLPVLINPEAP
jgi:hypothetical protein